MVAREERLLERSKKGRQILKDMKAYSAGSTPNTRMPTVHTRSSP